MEMVFRNLLAGLLLVSAVSAAQFTLEETMERVKTLAGMNEETLERASECAAHALRHEMAHLRPMVRELGSVASCVAARTNCIVSAKAAAKTMEGIWKAYGY
jgi:hypothetical protein